MSLKNVDEDLMETVAKAQSVDQEYALRIIIVWLLL